ncbi:hypothetical protein KNE206_79260 [Kitasatospora sp. NE20-6]|uniref:cytochrome P450 n=1 Tax=Kitasatospora sp. NE20-6 TaxID=2859066 RepID=UPI0034DCBB88
MPDTMTAHPIPAVPRTTLDAARLLGRLRRAPQATDELSQQLAALGPVIPTPWGGLLLTRFDDSRQILTDRHWKTLDAAHLDETQPGWRNHSSLRSLFSSVMQQNPPLHTTLRRRARAAVPTRIDDTLRLRIEELAEDCLDSLEHAARTTGVADFVTHVSDRLPALVMCVLLGLPEQDADELGRRSQTLALAQELSPSRTLLAEADAAADFLTGYLTRRLPADRPGAAPAACPYGHSATQPQPEPEEVVQAGLMLTAGVTTTSALLSRCLADLDRHRARARTLLADTSPEAVDALVEESLRLHPPATVLSRVSTRATELSGHPIASGQLVHALLPVAHRDPRAFTNPAQWDPQRWHPRRDGTSQSLAFGAGIHYCIGTRLARLEAAVVLRAVHRRFPEIHVAGAPAFSSSLALPKHFALPVALGKVHCASATGHAPPSAASFGGTPIRHPLPGARHPDERRPEAGCEQTLGCAHQ